MDSIKKDLQIKKQSILNKLENLKEIKQLIFELTNIKPTSLKIHKHTLIIKTKNPYEAAEIRYKQEILKNKLKYIHSIKITQ